MNQSEIRALASCVINNEKCLDELAQVIHEQISPLENIISVTFKDADNPEINELRVLAEVLVQAVVIGYAKIVEPVLFGWDCVNPESVTVMDGHCAMIARTREWRQVFSKGVELAAKWNKVSEHSIFHIAGVLTMDDDLMDKARQMHQSSEGVKARHELEFKKACEDVRPHFANFKAGKLVIHDARGREIPRDRWRKETFVSHCLNVRVGWGREMLRKVYDELSTLTG